MKLETERLYIVPCTEERIQIANEQGYNSGPHIVGHVKNVKQDVALLPWGAWYVLRKEDDSVLGDIGFKGKPNENQTVEIGYGFIEKYWNMGYATEAVRELIDWAFKTGEVETIIAETLLDNYSSIRVLEKLHMKRVNATETMINWKIEK
ncbi:MULTISPECIES: GNAT family N-acetyltransferase [Bacillus]|uniref:GNAT family N-acetyltransferase n=3 Tax=Bacillus thuringiensis TaxID=1428 RepID=A0AAP4Q9P7_BACTU|nr:MULTISPECIES: GNAT family N-acetyltransferase [Bacillus]MEC2874996.1 GNAT family N-acetyltransferase [Bacillus cereus]AEA16714.1 ribosomal-protein-alanine acetyltransferase [Bacillus thuringiensis serovar chinensis CT-43]AFV18849.1 ribosomal-protein-alanine acetyltransferase [Bacillus thuringiensis Bt407]AGG01802.1 acetyltransferase, GNAT family [Bacillus thuringiensis serovar thuringiensis str. IS5056]ARP58400.1 N-acetyltransferase [Bacillus thuringiensis]